VAEAAVTFERFTPEAARVVERAQEEARRLRNDYLGTEHLLLGLFGEDTVASRVLEARGLGPENVLEHYRGIVGPCDEPAAGPPDPDALASIGVDLDEVRRRVEEAFGPGALERTMAWCRRAGLRLTPRAKKALELAGGEAADLGRGRIGPEHLLLGLAAEREGLAAMILARHGATVAVLRCAVLDQLRRSA